MGRERQTRAWEKGMAGGGRGFSVEVEGGGIAEDQGLLGGRGADAHTGGKEGIERRKWERERGR
eukprot:4915732-Pleurochrysis_carterae.AAC.1